MVNTWVLTSWLLSRNRKLPAVHKILLARNQAEHSICQPPAERIHAPSYRVNLVTLQSFARLWFLWLKDVSFKGSSFHYESSLHSSTCLDLEDSTWHKKTHFLITFYSFLSTTLSLIPCMWYTGTRSPDWIPWARWLTFSCRLFMFPIISSKRCFLCNHGQFPWLIPFVAVCINIFSFLKYPVGFSKPFDFQLFFCDSFFLASTLHLFSYFWSDWHICHDHFFFYCICLLHF